jgi:carbon-monoxide dehydrogenase small subunit
LGVDAKRLYAKEVNGMEPIKTKEIQLKVNGKEHALEVRVNETLARVLREKLGLTGIKIGCDTGSCGACTVLIDGQAFLSCLTLALEAEGKEVLTIEGLEDSETGELHPIQASFVENHGVQCGYCTPGMIMSAKALLDDNPNPSEEEIKDGISGNLCRCTGYVSIIDSISKAARKMGR